jgi:hypothetical protein
MRCLSLWQPWASAIFEKDDKGVQIKPDETRPWSTAIRERIYIHAAKHVIPYELQERYDPILYSLGLRFPFLPFGMILGSVEIVNCRVTHVVALERTEAQRFWGDYRTIGDDGKQRYALELRNPIKLTAPIPWKGSQKFFEVNL